MNKFASVTVLFLGVLIIMVACKLLGLKYRWMQGEVSPIPWPEGGFFGRVRGGESRENLNIKRNM
jgi:hypothetical protein